MVRDHGIEFIGPLPDQINKMGDKSTARDTMKRAGVPTVPGSEGIIRTDEEAEEVKNFIGLPVMIKATAGGGGRGMRLAKTEEEFLPLLKQAQQEAEAAFGNGAVYIERYVQNPRHIEFQVRAHAWCTTWRRMAFKIFCIGDAQLHPDAQLTALSLCSL